MLASLSSCCYSRKLTGLGMGGPWREDLEPLADPCLMGPSGEGSTVPRARIWRPELLKRALHCPCGVARAGACRLPASLALLTPSTMCNRKTEKEKEKKTHKIGSSHTPLHMGGMPQCDHWYQGQHVTSVRLLLGPCLSLQEGCLPRGGCLLCPAQARVHTCSVLQDWPAWSLARETAVCSLSLSAGSLPGCPTSFIRTLGPCLSLPSITLL